MENGQEKHPASTSVLHMHAYTAHTLMPHTYEHTDTHMHITPIHKKEEEQEKEEEEQQEQEEE